MARTATDTSFLHFQYRQSWDGLHRLAGVPHTTSEINDSHSKENTVMAIRTNEGNRVRFVPTDYGEIAQDITGMGDAEELVYHRFMLFYMSKGHLPADEEGLKRIARINGTDDEVNRAIMAFTDLEIVYRDELVDKDSGEVRAIIRHEEWDNMLAEARAKVDEYTNRTKKAREAKAAKNGGGNEG